MRVGAHPIKGSMFFGGVGAALESLSLSLLLMLCVFAHSGQLFRISASRGFLGCFVLSCSRSALSSSFFCAALRFLSAAINARALGRRSVPRIGFGGRLARAPVCSCRRASFWPFFQLLPLLLRKRLRRDSHRSDEVQILHDCGLSGSRWIVVVLLVHVAIEQNALRKHVISTPSDR